MVGGEIEMLDRNERKWVGGVFSWEGEGILMGTRGFLLEPTKIPSLQFGEVLREKMRENRGFEETPKLPLSTVRVIVTCFFFFLGLFSCKCVFVFFPLSTWFLNQWVLVLFFYFLLLFLKSIVASFFFS